MGSFDLFMGTISIAIEPGYFVKTLDLELTPGDILLLEVKL